MRTKEHKEGWRNERGSERRVRNEKGKKGGMMEDGKDVCTVCRVYCMHRSIFPSTEILIDLSW